MVQQAICLIFQLYAGGENCGRSQITNVEGVGLVCRHTQVSFDYLICTQVPIFAFVGGFYLSKCSFSIGFFKAAHIVSEFYLNSLWVQQSYGNQSKCWNVQPSCSSHHVECTKTWMRDVSSVLWGDRTLFLKLDSQPTLVLPNIRNKNRATVADDRARCDTPKNLCIVLILPLAALRITYGKRISSDACLYTAFKWNSCSQ